MNRIIAHVEKVFDNKPYSRVTTHPVSHLPGDIGWRCVLKYNETLITGDTVSLVAGIVGDDIDKSLIPNVKDPEFKDQWLALRAYLTEYDKVHTVWAGGGAVCIEFVRRAPNSTNQETASI